MLPSFFTSFNKGKSFIFFTNKKGLFGFTLIELLVVIAILILLSSIVMVAARNVREKGKDTGIIANLSQVRTEATLIKNTTGLYNDLCAGGFLNTGNSNLAKIDAEVRKYNGNQNIDCYANDENYCVQSPLVAGGYYCFDSTGYAGVIPNDICDGVNFSCQ